MPTKRAIHCKWVSGVFCNMLVCQWHTCGEPPIPAALWCTLLTLGVSSRQQNLIFVPPLQEKTSTLATQLNGSTALSSQPFRPMGEKSPGLVSKFFQHWQGHERGIVVAVPFSG